MKFAAILVAAASLVLGVMGWARYADCKCHDSRTQLQNDDATKFACARYKDSDSRAAVYSDTPHHQCHNGFWYQKPVMHGGIDNGDWDALCKQYDSNMYQYCWNR